MATTEYIWSEIVVGIFSKLSSPNYYDYSLNGFTQVLVRSVFRRNGLMMMSPNTHWLLPEHSRNRASTPSGYRVHLLGPSLLATRMGANTGS